MVHDVKISAESRQQLLDWLQRDFDCCIQKVEQCGTGAMYLQIMDRSFPGVVAMNRVVWHANQEYEMTKNYKYLQEVFKICGLNRAFDISKLSKGKQLDNLELLQYMKAVYDKRNEQNPNPDYRAWERRMMGVGPFPEWSLPMSQSERKEPIIKSGSSAVRSTRGPLVPSSRKMSQGGKSSLLRSPSTAGGTGNGPNYNTDLENRLSALNSQLVAIREEHESMAEKKKFYENKLIAIETLLVNPGPDSLQKIRDVLECESYVQIDVIEDPENAVPLDR